MQSILKMKKIILIICFSLGINQISIAQINFGIKGGLNYNSESNKEGFRLDLDDVLLVGENVFKNVETKAGYHLGIWLRAKVPIIGIYIRPELVYTSLENSMTYTNLGGDSEVTDFSFQKIDIPVLFGKKFLGVGNIYIGPSFQYILKQGFSMSNISDVKGDDFTIGIQYGVGIELGKIGLDIRWERGFSSIESSIIEGSTNIEFDTRVNQVIFGLSYKL
ncbi:MAG: Uncharacterised protein [Polaribacter sp. SA4-10]|nr:MAG: Uncharacterised protein [Polaribacter sp. SA4-10]